MSNTTANKTEHNKDDKKRLKIIGTEYKSEQLQNNQEQTKSQPGQIFEESTQSISSMTKDMQEAAKIVSSMKTELEEKRSRIADLLASGNPLSNPFKTQPESAGITKHKRNVELSKTQKEQNPSNQLQEIIVTRLDTIIEQNQEIIKLLNSKSDQNTSLS